MSEASVGSEKFRMRTNEVPEGVDLELAAERNALIEHWRAGEVSAEDAHYQLLALYWRSQCSAGGGTRVYLMQSAYQFPAEAGISFEASEEIYDRTYNDLRRT